MKHQLFLLLLFITVALCGVETNNDDILENYIKFQNWQQKYNVNYDNQIEEYKRFEIFSQNLDIIKQLQEQNPKTKYGPTQFADLTYQEFQEIYLLKKIITTPLNNTRRRPTKGALDNFPDSFDWREYGAVTPVKNQLQCGCCWSFAATANIEGQYFLKHNDTMQEAISFSEQQLVDCDTIDNGCKGGGVQNAYTWLQENEGLETYENYPYTGVNGTCQFNSSLAVAQVIGHEPLTNIESELPALLVQIGPLSAGVHSDTDWQHYQGGILNPQNCTATPDNHAVTIVGYGTMTYSDGESEDYWIIKNSWGQTWGINGYVYLNRGNGTCGINTAVSTSYVA